MRICFPNFLAIKYPFYPRLVPDDTVYEGTIKCHKIDKERTYLAVHMYPSVFIVKN